MCMCKLLCTAAHYDKRMKSNQLTWMRMAGRICWKMFGLVNQLLRLRLPQIDTQPKHSHILNFHCKKTDTWKMTSSLAVWYWTVAQVCKRYPQCHDNGQARTLYNGSCVWSETLGWQTRARYRYFVCACACTFVHICQHGQTGEEIPTSSSHVIMSLSLPVDTMHHSHLS